MFFGENRLDVPDDFRVNYFKCSSSLQKNHKAQDFFMWLCRNPKYIVKCYPSVKKSDSVLNIDENREKCVIGPLQMQISVQFSLLPIY